MSLADAVRLAVGTFTVLPTGPVEVDRRTAATAMIIAPLAVLPLALAVALVTGLGRVLAAPPPLLAVLALAVLALGNRALHLDGLADTADGLGSGWDAERALVVMRRGDTGPMGVVAVVLVLGAQATAIAELLTRPWGWLAVALAVCGSRAALALACARPVRSARPTGLGAAVIGTVPVPTAGVVAALTVIGWGLAGRAVGPDLITGVIAGAAALALVALITRWCTVRLGGLTGDVLGACVELAFAVLLVGLAL